MLLSRKFLKDYIDIDASTKDIADNMTKIGNEYDSITSLASGTNLVIGKVLECNSHPDSDHLHVCLVDVGFEKLTIVCGAPNVEAGKKVIVALPNAILPDITIKKSVIRGVESNGMLCSLAELGMDHKYLKEEDLKGIHLLDDNAPIGEDALKYLDLDDEIIDFELTSNRGDLLSILGMAYEVGAIYDKKVKDIDLSYDEIDDSISGKLDLKVNTDSCKLFLAKRVNNVVIKESPLFIKNRLMASGIRPINNVVDISNYVMLETGQPLHFYDADRLGDTLEVRMANDMEKLTTLDGEKRSLSNEDIVISNGKNAIGLAGVMGGISTEIENDTKNIIIESAIFDAAKIRYTSKKVLRSEASNRFEKGLDPKRTYMALDRACHLLKKYASGSVLKEKLEYKNISLDDKVIDITLEKINQVLGLNIPLEEVLKVFSKLGFTYEVDGHNIKVIVPSRRIDISIKEDLIEEVGRIYGVDNILGKMPITKIKVGSYNKDYRLLRDKLISLGFNETITYTLINEKDSHKFTNDTFEEIKVLEPMTEERTTLRHSLIPSLLSVFEYNKARNIKDISLFEIGKSFSKVDDNYLENYLVSGIMSGNYYFDNYHYQEADFYIIKGVIEEILHFLGLDNRYSFRNDNLVKELHPYQALNIIIDGKEVGYFGKINPTVTKDNIYVFEINLEKIMSYRVSPMKYKEISKYPTVSKDLAFIVSKDVTADTIMKTIKKAGGKLLKDTKLFDVYENEEVYKDKKSLAFTLTFGDDNKTLTEEEVVVIFNKIIDKVVLENNAVLRDN